MYDHLTRWVCTSGLEADLETTDNLAQRVLESMTSEGGELHYHPVRTTANLLPSSLPPSLHPSLPPSLPPSLVPSFPAVLRSQRDVAGEKESLREDLQRKQEQLTSLEEKSHAAEQDKTGKEEEVQTITSELRRHQLVWSCVCV